MHRFTGPPEGPRQTLVAVTLLVSLVFFVMSILASILLLVFG